MNKMMLIVVLLAFCTLAFAQAGMFGIEAGAGADKVDRALKQQGFQVKESSDSKTVYNHPKKANLKSLDVIKDSSTGAVVEWLVLFDISKEDTSGAAILAEIKKLHGDTDVEDDFDADYIWYFSDDRALYVTVDEGDTILLDYASGNYDDDYDWYCYDDWYW